jgi:hypothetical protein
MLRHCSSSRTRSAQTASRHIHTVIDQLYAQLTSTSLNSKFFESGFGFDDEYGDLPTFHSSVQEMRGILESSEVPHIDMKKRADLPAPNVSIYEGSFRTPVASTQRLLPGESTLAHVQYVLPKEPSQIQATIVHLAATGDHGFNRRLLAYALPLAAQHGVASMILESPFYGVRKPAYQNRSKLKTLSDLLVLGKATIEESLYLLKYLAEREGGGRGRDRTAPTLGISGVSMGGVHACMVASLFSNYYSPDVALIPLLAPRSAAEAYCRGALRVSTSWDGLQRDFEARDVSALLERVRRDMEAGDVLSDAGEVSWALLQELERAPQAGADKLQGAPSHTRLLAELILHTYTDLTRFPPPKRSDAAVIVGGSDDGYVGTQSVRDVGSHLKGGEVRWVKGGHVSSFVLQHSSFVRAMIDSLKRLSRHRA